MFKSIWCHSKRQEENSFLDLDNFLIFSLFYCWLFSLPVPVVGHRPDQWRHRAWLWHHRRTADGGGGEDHPAGGSGGQGRAPPSRGLYPPDQRPVAQGRGQRTGRPAQFKSLFMSLEIICVNFGGILLIGSSNIKRLFVSFETTFNCHLVFKRIWPPFVCKFADKIYLRTAENSWCCVQKSKPNISLP